MKRYHFFGLAVLFLVSCQDMTQDEILPNPLDGELNKTNFKPEIDIIDFEKKMSLYELNNQKRLANSTHLKKNCSTTIKVPFDFPTIQQAVDNICEGGNVLVNSGSYFEEVYLNKPNIKIKAIGTVELLGGFILNEFADGTSIQNFKIRPTNPIGGGIMAYKADELTIMQNEVNDFSLVGNFGIVLRISNGSKIKNNTIDGSSWGIGLIAYEFSNEVKSRSNEISNNTISNFNASGILLEGNVDENVIKNNEISGHAFFRVPPFGGGIALLSVGNLVNPANVDENQIKNNKVSDVTIGFLINNSNSGNEIIGNEFINNSNIGIYSLISPNGSESNTFKNNKVRGNSNCDIVDESSKNIYINNLADCVNVN